MPDYVIQLDPTEYPTGQAVLRVRTDSGKYAEFVIKNGDTLTTKDATVALALDAQVQCVAKLASKPAKVTTDVDVQPKADLPKADASKEPKEPKA